MKFKIVKCLSEDESKEQLDINLSQYVTKLIYSEVDSENVYKAIVEIDEIMEIQELGCCFDDDIIIWGADMDCISPSKTSSTCDVSSSVL